MAATLLSLLSLSGAVPCAVQGAAEVEVLHFSASPPWQPNPGPDWKMKQIPMYWTLRELQSYRNWDTVLGSPASCCLRYQTPSSPLILDISFCLPLCLCLSWVWHWRNPSRCCYKTGRCALKLWVLWGVSPGLSWGWEDKSTCYLEHLTVLFWGK